MHAEMVVDVRWKSRWAVCANARRLDGGREAVEAKVMRVARCSPAKSGGLGRESHRRFEAAGEVVCEIFTRTVFYLRELSATKY